MVRYEADVVIVGGGLAGLVTALELLSKNRRVVLLDRDEPERLGGLAREAFGASFWLIRLISAGCVFTIAQNWPGATGSAARVLVQKTTGHVNGRGATVSGQFRLFLNFWIG